MLNAIILERKHEDIAARTAENLNRLKWSFPEGLVILPRLSKRCSPELISISVRAAGGLNLRRQTGCSTLLIPGKYSPCCLSAEHIVRYGMSSADCITLSSVSSSGYVISIQREFKTLTGKIIERQDIPLRRTLRASTDCILATAGTLLLLGVPPEKLI